MTDNRGKVAFWNRAGQRIFGYSEDEARGKTLHELIIPERNRIDFQNKFIDFRTDGEGSAGGKTVEIAGRRKDGVELVAEVSISGVKINAIWHALFIFRDITERKRAEQLLGLEYTVARCLAGTDDTSQALKAVIRAVCESQNWECGRYLRTDAAAGVLRLVEFWNVPDAASQGFLVASQGFTFGPGVGMPGKVWQSGQPLWIADITKDARAMTNIFKAESGIRGALVFPVKVEGKTIGVFAFNSDEIREPDAPLLAAMDAIDRLVGQFLQRKHAETA
jgi:PAS domain S-box-containing protein